MYKPRAHNIVMLNIIIYTHIDVWWTHARHLSMLDPLWATASIIIINVWFRRFLEVLNPNTTTTVVAVSNDDALIETVKRYRLGYTHTHTHTWNIYNENILYNIILYLRYNVMYNNMYTKRNNLHVVIIMLILFSWFFLNNCIFTYDTSKPTMIIGAVSLFLFLNNNVTICCDIILSIIICLLSSHSYKSLQ